MHELFEFVQIMRQVAPDQRNAAMFRYTLWSLRAALAQGWYALGGIPLAASAFVAYRLFKSGEPALAIYALCAIGAVAGIWLGALGYQRERAWKRAHPFQIRGEDAQVL